MKGIGQWWHFSRCDALAVQCILVLRGEFVALQCASVRCLRDAPHPRGTHLGTLHTKGHFNPSEAVSCRAELGLSTKGHAQPV